MVETVLFWYFGSLRVATQLCGFRFLIFHSGGVFLNTSVLFGAKIIKLNSA